MSCECLKSPIPCDDCQWNFLEKTGHFTKAEKLRLIAYRMGVTKATAKRNLKKYGITLEDD